MKKITFVKVLAAVCSLAFFSACSPQQYNFAPGTGAYHGEIKKAPVTAQTLPAEEQPVYAAAENNVTPETISTPQVEASAALAQAFTAQKATATTSETVTKADKKASRQMVKQVKHQLKTLKKRLKDSKSDKGLGLNNNVKLLLILGLAFILVGALLHVGIIYTIGAILLIIGLILLLMEIL